MGLDIAMGLVVLASAIRGYLRGFVLQAIRLAGLAASPFLADPIRDYLQPQLAPQFPTMAPELLSRLIWWSAAVLSFMVLTGLGGLTYRLSQRRTMGEPEANYADQGAGFLLGLAKGAVWAIALIALFDQYALNHLKQIPWVDDQAKTSQALALSKQYEPARKLWESPPVQAYVAQVRRNGSLEAKDATSAVVEALAQSRKSERPADATTEPAKADANGSPAQETQQAQAKAPPSLVVPRRPLPQPGSPSFLHDFDEELKREGMAPRSR